MDEIFKDMTHEGWIIIYMDDVFIFTREIFDNIRQTRKVLQCLKENDLYLKPEKCVFWQTKVEYLGLIIEQDKLAMDPVKLAGIADWPTPTTETSTIIFRIRKLLPSIHTWIWKSHKTAKRTTEERRTILLD